VSEVVRGDGLDPGPLHRTGEPSPRRIRTEQIRAARTGEPDVVVDTRPDVTTDGPTAGLTVGAGQTVTIPRADPDSVWAVWVVTAGGSGEVTYLLPG
jgi:hypothetical protein